MLWTIRDATAFLHPDKTLYLVSEDDSGVSISPLLLFASAFHCDGRFCCSWGDSQFPLAYLKDVAHRTKSYGKHGT